MNIAIISGWFGKSCLAEFDRFDDGRSDFILKLITYLGENNFNVITDLSEIKKNRIDYEIHLNVQIPLSSAPKILIYLEDVEIRPQNFFLKIMNYSKVFSWDERLRFFSKNFTKLDFPHDITIDDKLILSNRKNLFSMIASNRNVFFNRSCSLYNKRQDVINYFELNSDYDFSLYGSGWDLSFAKVGFSSRIITELGKRNFFPKSRRKIKNWKGTVRTKKEILTQTKFNFCYENMLGPVGYISEKIYDSIQYGAVPIYYPSFNNIQNYIPSNIFVDASKFNNVHEIVMFCSSLSDGDREEYITRGFNFLSTVKDKISSESFAKSIYCNLLC